MSGRQPAEQWWTLNGADLMESLRRCQDGESADLVYLELLVNSESHDYGSDE